mmetsp:Transcript_41502/g.90369  ORF Transcript_41502/g.90369 Transcript_41502/m.90369 type:complete len:264 (+) Transcript_41502:1106-1897(+)
MQCVGVFCRGRLVGPAGGCSCRCARRRGVRCACCVGRTRHSFICGVAGGCLLRHACWRGLACVHLRAVRFAPVSLPRLCTRCVICHPPLGPSAIASVRLPLLARCLACFDLLLQQLQSLHGVRREIRLLLGLKTGYIDLHRCRIVHRSFFSVVVNLVPLLVGIVGMLGCRLGAKLGHWGNIFDLDLLILILFRQRLLLQFLSCRLHWWRGRDRHRHPGLRSDGLPALSERRQSSLDLGAQPFHLLQGVLTRGDLTQRLSPRWG